MENLTFNEFQPENKLKTAISVARQRRDFSLIRCLKHLKQVEKNRPGTTTEIYNDFAPLSFYFVRKYKGEYSSNGGIMFHGKHDGYGSGSAPTFSVSLTPVDGWEIHT